MTPARSQDQSAKCHILITWRNVGMTRWGTWPFHLRHWRSPEALLCCKHAARGSFYLHLTCQGREFWSDQCDRSVFWLRQGPQCLPSCYWMMYIQSWWLDLLSYDLLASLEPEARCPEFLNGRAVKNLLKRPGAILAEIGLLWNRITGKWCNESNGEWWWLKHKSQGQHVIEALISPKQGLEMRHAFFGPFRSPIQHASDFVRVDYVKVYLRIGWCCALVLRLNILYMRSCYWVLNRLPAPANRTWPEPEGLREGSQGYTRDVITPEGYVDCSCSCPRHELANYAVIYHPNCCRTRRHRLAAAAVCMSPSSSSGGRGWWYSSPCVSACVLWWWSMWDWGGGRRAGWLRGSSSSVRRCSSASSRDIVIALLTA